MLLSLLCLLEAHNPIVAWSKQNFGAGWKAGTEITDPFSEQQFATLLKDIMQKSVLIHNHTRI